MTMARDAMLKRLAAEFGLDFTDEIRAVPKYEVAIEHDGQLFISGQIPRVRGALAVAGKLGADASLEEGRRAARICIVRALVIVRQTVGSLDRVKKLLRLNVYVQSAPNFTEQSEVADAASEILYALFEPAGGHTRTAVGVVQLPKNAAVELDLLLALGAPESTNSTF